MAPALKDVGKWVDIEDYYINQAMVLLKHSEINASVEAQQFYKFLKSKKARDIFKKHGYTVD